MDNFLNTFLSSSWSDVNESANRPWLGTIDSQTDNLLADSMESFQVDGKNSAMTMMPSSHIMGNVSADDLTIAQESTSSFFSDGSLNYGNGLYLAGNLSRSQQPNQSSHGIEASEGSFSMPDTVTCNSTGIPYGLELNSSLSCSAITISSSLESSGSEPPTFGQPIGEAHSISSVPTIWPSSFSGISSLNGQQKVENFSFEGMANGADLLRKSEGTNLKHQLGHSSNSHQQMTQSNGVGCNVASKPRVRARRGQATDPHSIAERLRREKIAERMKNLQELVPNSNKTDKASMLDEIIEYVKFLQLQVKVLSMSRLGAAGAVVPLITDVQAEDTGSLHLSPIGGGVDILESPENVAFEQEVVKLLESSVTTAMQYLQNKGLCLMPIALATAISSQKGKQDLNERIDHQDDELNLCSGLIAKQEEERDR